MDFVTGKFVVCIFYRDIKNRLRKKTKRGKISRELLKSLIEYGVIDTAVNHFKITA